MQVEVDYEILDITTPVEDLSLTEGEHFIVVGDFNNSFYRDKEAYITVIAGSTMDLPVELERNQGTLMVNCNIEEASVYINGKKEGTVKGGKARIRNLPAGTIEVTVLKDRYYQNSEVINLRPGSSNDLTMNLRPMPVRILFDSNPQGAEVVFDGKSRGKTPTAVEDISQGNNSYYVRYNGYMTSERSVSISGVEDRTIIEDLYAPLTIRMTDPADHEADVYIDGKYSGTTESGVFRAENVSLGDHKLLVEKTGYGSLSDSIKISESGLSYNANLRLDDVKVSIITEPGQAEVVLNGKLEGGLTPMTLNLSEGRHELVIRKKGFSACNRNRCDRFAARSAD